MKMKRAISSLLITILLAGSLNASVFAATTDVKLNGVITSLNIEPVKAQSDTMVDLKQMCDLLGATMTRNEKDNTVTVAKQATKATISLGGNFLTIDTREFKIDPPPVWKGDKLMVSTWVLNKIFDGAITIDPKTDAIAINTKDTNGYFINRATSASEATTTLTYAEALDKALKRNTTITNLLQSVEYMENARQQQQDSLSTILSSGTSFATTQTAALIVAIRDINTNIKNVPTNEQKLKEYTELSLVSSLNAIKGDEQDKQLLTNSIQLENINIKNMELKNSLGLESEFNVSQAKKNHEQNLTNLKNLEIALQNERIALNNLLGLKATDLVSVEYPSAMKTLDIDLDQYITTVLEKDPEVTAKKQAVSQAQYAMDTYKQFSPYNINPLTGQILSEDTSDVKLKLDVDTAYRALEDTKSNLQKAIRTTYNQLKQLEEKAVSLNFGLEKAKDTYNTTYVNYTAGMVTSYEVEQAKLGITNAEVAIEKNKDSYNMLLFTFNHPYMLLK